ARRPGGGTLIYWRLSRYRLDKALEGHLGDRRTEMCRLPMQPAIDVRALARVGREEQRAPMRAREIGEDRVRFPEHELAVDEHRDQAVRVERLEGRRASLAPEDVHCGELELEAQLVRDGTDLQAMRGARELIQLHGPAPQVASLVRTTREAKDHRPPQRREGRCILEGMLPQPRDEEFRTQ